SAAERQGGQERLERNPAALIPASAQAASSAGASPDAPAAPSLVFPSALKTATPPATVTTCGANAKPGVSFAPSAMSAVGKPQAATASALAIAKSIIPDPFPSI